MAVAQWVKGLRSGHRVVQAEGSGPGGVYTNCFAAMIFFQFVRPLTSVI